MKIIVTGASGFIGTWLVKYLISKDNEVIAIGRDQSAFFNNEKITWLNLDLTNECEIQKIKKLKDVDLMYHLAWNGAGGIARSDFDKQIKNVLMSVELYKIASEIGIKKFISIGTIGERFADLIIKNSMKSENLFYILTKDFLHKVLYVESNKSNTRFVWCTLTGIYGIGDNTKNLVNYTISSLLEKKMPEYGPANKLFDFVNVKDCVSALYQIGICKTDTSVFTIGSGNPKILKEWLEIIQKTVNPNQPLGIGKRKDDGTVYEEKWFDCSALFTETNYRPSIDFADGIREIVNEKAVL